MHTKLTLRMDEGLVRKAKAQAAQRGKSVSGMFSEIVHSLDTEKANSRLPPITSSLMGAMKNHPLSEEDYKKHLREKHA
ncbi:MAG: antitoxin [Verrucomicrobia bacterium]|nr:antitoxin [Verrucomicrobiota bacterium]MCH8514574.1 DUF6364 family protein [Kiritimatiellia bacterium]